MDEGGAEDRRDRRCRINAGSAGRGVGLSQARARRRHQRTPGITLLVPILGRKPVSAMARGRKRRTRQPNILLLSSTPVLRREPLQTLLPFRPGRMVSGRLGGSVGPHWQRPVRLRLVAGHCGAGPSSRGGYSVRGSTVSRRCRSVCPRGARGALGLRLDAVHPLLCAWLVRRAGAGAPRIGAGVLAAGYEPPTL